MPLQDLNIPADILVHIFSYMLPSDILRAARVNRTWHLKAYDNILWKNMCLRRDIEPFIDSHHNKDASTNYMREYRRAHNWTKGKYTCDVWYGHKDIITCLQLERDKIISGSQDNTIKVWKIESGTCINTLRGHEYGITCLSTLGDRIVSGGSDGTIRSWDRESGKCLRTIFVKNAVWSLQTLDNKVFGGCFSGKVGVFDLHTGQELNNFYEHTKAVSCLQVVQVHGEPILISGSYDGTIRMWDMSGKCISTIHAHADNIRCLQFDTNLLVTGGKDALVKVWDLRSDLSGRCIHKFQAHKHMVTCLQVKGNKLVTGSVDSTIKLWNVNSGEHLNTLEVDYHSVSALQVSQTKLFGGFLNSHTSFRLFVNFETNPRK